MADRTTIDQMPSTAPAQDRQTPVLELRNVSKRFPGVVALDDVSFDLYAGEVHVLVGENGAGKSTLVKILSGIYQPDSGEMLLDGRKIAFGDPHEAQVHGVSTVHQELNLVPHLNVGKNIYLGREPLKAGIPGVIDWKAVMDGARRELEDLGVPIDPKASVRELGVAHQQMVEIAKALIAHARVLILDEPTAAITAEEAEQLFTIVDQLRAQGTAIILISHHLEDVYRAGDRVTVLRDGRYVATKPVSETTQYDLIRMMVGRELTQQYPKEQFEPGATAIKVAGLNRHGVLHDISFEIRRGEIVGLAGLVGAGRSEVARAIFGVDPIDSGSIEINGRPVTITDPNQAIAHRIALLPEDRKQQGLVLLLSVADNTVVAAPQRVGRFPWLITPAARGRVAKRFIDALRIKTPGAGQQVRNLSGGNQQKVVLAKWLLTDADIFIFDEPTRGIDVGAKVEVYRLMNELLRNGAAILMISSELPEILGMSDRVLVMREGRIVAELDRHEATQEVVMTYAAAEAGEAVA